MSIILSLFASDVAGHAGIIAIGGADGHQWAYKANDGWNAGSGNWYSSGADQYIDPGRLQGQGMSGDEIAVYRQQKKLEFHSQPGVPSQDRRQCNGSTPADKPQDAIPNKYEVPTPWREEMWGWKPWPTMNWTENKKVGFCPGELVSWRHYIAADHNGADALIVMMDADELPHGAQPKRSADDWGYMVTDWTMIGHDYVDRAAGNTKYYNNQGQPVDTSTCTNGQSWDITIPHCSDAVYRESYFHMPEWFENGKSYTLMWQWYSGLDINANGDLTQPDKTNAEMAYFGQCIQVTMKSAAECGSNPPSPSPTTKGPQPKPTTKAPEPKPTTHAPTTEPTGSCPLQAMCMHDGINASCGDRINWVISNRGMTRADAGNLVASECSSCVACGHSSSTTSAPSTTKPATTQPQGGNKCQVCYWNCQDIANWSTRTAAWDNESEGNCKQTTGTSSCYCFGPSVQACHAGFSHIDGTSCSRRLNEIMI